MSATEIDAVEPLAALRALREQERDVARAKRDRIAEARRAGRSWAEIGEALGVSRQAAWELYNAEVTALLDRAAERSGLTEDEAMTLAMAEVESVRRHRSRRIA